MFYFLMTWRKISTSSRFQCLPSLYNVTQFLFQNILYKLLSLFRKRIFFFKQSQILVEKWGHENKITSLLDLIRCVHAQLCLTLCNPMDCSPPGSSVHGTLQARIVEWVAISFSGGSSWPRDGTHIPWVSCISRCILHHNASWESPLNNIEWKINTSRSSRF